VRRERVEEGEGAGDEVGSDPRIGEELDAKSVVALVESVECADREAEGSG
jgi:hypothetical protein